jgi:hypothetical protein
MNKQHSVPVVGNGHRHFGCWLLRGAMIALLLSAARPVAAQEQHASKDKDSIGFGFNLSKDAGAKEVGLPWYPGAKRYKDKSDDSSSVQLGLWGGSSGFKLAVLKLESNDTPEKIAAFYRKALAKYGKVLDCTNTADAEHTSGDHERKNSSNGLDCESDRPEKSGLVMKAGTKEKQHVVGIQAEGSHSLFQLVYVEMRGSDSKK